ncbi:hypothetical protein B1R32_105145 [Abditibacterium utsteinense]|uniref:4-amino-4-deoxy-L-arabinose transferase n=1 Tax=Abditibacterium utsteinense TaxID=1960156 RepID=A0A2S8SUI3_9BACT|nr:hypothetical protein [Abditibacterium utsteinense]PQV64463.1 hypothetical protein B1R32_105145 [Abditibacterium utsteinense]
MIASTLQNAAPLPAAPPDSILPPLWGRMETLWLAMAPLCALLYTLCLPLAPNDLWYHVRAGELMSRGAIPTQNLMSSAVPLGASYFYQSWLAELILFWTLRLGGLSALALLRSFFVAGALLLVTASTFRFLLRRSRPPSRLVAARFTAFSAIIGLAMASNNVDLRPQVFSLFFFGAWTFLILEFRAASNPRTRTRHGVFLVILTLVWANTHGAFVVSLLGLFALSLGDFLWRHERFKACLIVALASSVAALANPRGAALYAYVAGLSRDEVSQKFVQEWKSPGFDDWHSLLFWLAALGIFAAFFVAFRSQKIKRSSEPNPNLTLIVPTALFLAMAARDQRSIVWFALWFVPVFAALFCDFAPDGSKTAPPVPRAAQIINALLLLCLALGPLALFPQFKANWPWPREFSHRFAPTPSFFVADPPLLLENTTPVAAAQFLMKNPPRGRLFTDMVCGSYLTYVGRGQIRPLCDPRIELFPVTFWEDYLKLSAGPPNATAQLEKRGFSDVLLDSQNMPALVRRFRQSPQWKVVAQNGSTLLFRLMQKNR